MVYRACPQLLKECAIPFGVFARRELGAMLAAHLGFAKPEHRTKGRICEERPPLQVLNSHPDRTRIERIVEKLHVKRLCRFSHRAVPMLTPVSVLMHSSNL